MTVKELIDILQQQNLDTTVVYFNKRVDGYQEVSDTRQICVHLHRDGPNRPRYGYSANGNEDTDCIQLIQEKTMTLLEGKILEMLARTLRDHAHIVSGAYKRDKTEQSCEKTEQYPTGWRPLTEEEHLRKWLSIMDRHIQFLDECVQKLGT